jgi:NAD(P)-dependent dehydrogenase (short-subunit alcohol dehydrogenase family)
MPALDDVKALNSTLIQSQPLVAVFFGGTGGIGHATLCELVKAEAASGKGLRAYIVGRDASAGEKIMEDCRDVYPNGEFNFIKAVDLSLLKEADRICAEITRMEEKKGADARIDYLMMGQGGWPFKPRTGEPRW